MITAYLPGRRTNRWIPAPGFELDCPRTTPRFCRFGGVASDILSCPCKPEWWVGPRLWPSHSSPTSFLPNPSASSKGPQNRHLRRRTTNQFGPFGQRDIHKLRLLTGRSPMGIVLPEVYNKWGKGSTKPRKYANVICARPPRQRRHQALEMESRLKSISLKTGRQVRKKITYECLSRCIQPLGHLRVWGCPFVASCTWQSCWQAREGPSRSRLGPSNRESSPAAGLQPPQTWKFSE